MFGTISPWNGAVENVTSPIIDQTTSERTIIGTLAQMSEVDALEAVASAKAAWNKGQGTWPQMTALQRIEALERVVVSLKARRQEIVDVLMWEICKSTADAAAEFGVWHTDTPTHPHTLQSFSINLCSLVAFLLSYLPSQFLFVSFLVFAAKCMYVCIYICDP